MYQPVDEPDSGQLPRFEQVFDTDGTSANEAGVESVAQVLSKVAAKALHPARVLAISTLTVF